MYPGRIANLSRWLNEFVEKYECSVHDCVLMANYDKQIILNLYPEAQDGIKAICKVLSTLN